MHKLEQKIKEAERNKVFVDTELESLREDKHIKLKQLRDKKASESENAHQEVNDLELENRSKDDELARLQKLLADRKLLIEKTSAIRSAAIQAPPVS